MSRAADYLLAVKNNQRTLRACVEDALADVPVEGFEHADDKHGRTVLQHAQVVANTGQVDLTLWPDCKCIERIVSLRVDGKERQTLEARYYISSAALDHQTFLKYVRNHWAIENNLHWNLDVNFREDACTVSKDNSPQNLSVIRKINLNLIRQDTAHPKKSFIKRRKMAGWDDDERMRLLGIKALC